MLVDFVIDQTEFVGGLYYPGYCLTPWCPMSCVASYIFYSLPYCISEKEIKTEDSRRSDCEPCGSDYSCSGEVCLICPDSCVPNSCFINATDAVECCTDAKDAKPVTVVAQHVIALLVLVSTVQKQILNYQ